MNDFMRISIPVWLKGREGSIIRPPNQTFCIVTLMKRRSCPIYVHDEDLLTTQRLHCAWLSPHLCGQAANRSRGTLNLPWLIPASAPIPYRPRVNGKASASAVQSEFYPPNYACDGDWSTRWSSPSEDPHWIAFDLGKRSTLCGFVIHWEAAYSSSYRIEISRNGKRWRTVY